jgi:hypothetical protein
MEEVNLQSSIAQFKSFIDSPIWADMKREVQTWLDDVRNQLEQETTLEIYRRLQGNAEACRYFLGLPEVLIAALEESYGRADRSGTFRDSRGEPE